MEASSLQALVCRSQQRGKANSETRLRRRSRGAWRRLERWQVTRVPPTSPSVNPQLAPSTVQTFPPQEASPEGPLAPGTARALTLLICRLARPVPWQCVGAAALCPGHLWLPFCCSEAVQGSGRRLSGVLCRELPGHQTAAAS